MTEVKRGRGRPRKVIEPESSKNPDCEPATKGFVKCVVRKAAEHKHKYGFECGPIAIMVALLSLAWVFCVSIHESNLAWITGIGALMMISVGVSFSDDTTETSNIDGSFGTPYPYPDYLKKYTPPVVCEKKECGDD